MSEVLTWPEGWGTPPERVIEYTNDGRRSGVTVWLGDLENAANAVISVTGDPAGTLYGGRKKAEFTSDVWLYVDGGKNLNLYGGGYGAATGAVFLCVAGGTIGTVYGGGNGSSTVESIRMEIRGDVTGKKNITLGGRGGNALVSGDAVLTIAGVQADSAFADFNRILNGQYRTLDKAGKKITDNGDLVFSGSQYTMQGKLQNWNKVSLTGSTIRYDRFTNSSAANVAQWDIAEGSLLDLTIRSGVTIKSGFAGAGDLSLAGRGTYTFSGDNSGFSGTVTVGADSRIRVTGGTFFGGTVMLSEETTLQFLKGCAAFSGNLVGGAGAGVYVQGGTVSLRGDNSAFLGEYEIGSRGVMEFAAELPDELEITIASANGVLMLTTPPAAKTVDADESDDVEPDVPGDVEDGGEGEGGEGEGGEGEGGEGGEGEGEGEEPAPRTKLKLNGKGGTVFLGGNSVDIADYTGNQLTLYGGGTASGASDFTLTGTGDRKSVAKKIVAGGKAVPKLTSKSEMVIQATISSIYVKELVVGGESVSFSGSTVSGAVALNDVVAQTVYLGGIDCSASGKFSPETTISGGSIATVYGAGQKNRFSGSVNIASTITDGEFDRVYTGGNNVTVSSGTIAMKISGGVIDRLDAGGNKSTSTLGTFNTEISGGVIGSIYGGVNNSFSLGAVNVSISGGTVGEIYLGGTGNTCSNTPFELKLTDKAWVVGDIYAAGYSTGYGKGNSAGAVTVSVEGGLVSGNIYGGGWVTGYNAAMACTSSSIKITGGTVAGDIYGGGYAGQAANSICSGNAGISISGDALIAGDIYACGLGKGKFLTGSVSVEFKDTTAESVLADYDGVINGAFIASSISTGQKVSGRASMSFANYQAAFIGTLMNLSGISIAADSDVILRWNPDTWKNIDAINVIEGGVLTIDAYGDCTISSVFAGNGDLFFAGDTVYTLTGKKGEYAGVIDLMGEATLRLETNGLYGVDSFELGSEGALVLAAGGTVSAAISGGESAQIGVAAPGRHVVLGGSLHNFDGSMSVTGGTLTVSATRWDEVDAAVSHGTLIFGAAGDNLTLTGDNGIVFTGGNIAEITGQTVSGGTVFAGAAGKSTIEQITLTLTGGDWDGVSIFAGGMGSGNTVESSTVALAGGSFSDMVVSLDGAGSAVVNEAAVVLTGATDFSGTIRGGAKSSRVTFADYTGDFDGNLIAVTALEVGGATSLTLDAAQMGAGSISNYIFSQDGRSADLRDTAMLTVAGTKPLQIGGDDIVRTVNIDRFCFSSAAIGEESMWLLVTGVASLSGQSFTIGGLAAGTESITLLCDGDSIQINDESYRLVWQNNGLYLCGTIGGEGQYAMHWSAVLDMTGAPLSGRMFTSGGTITAAEYGYSDTAHQTSIKAIVSGTSGDVAAAGDVAGSVWLNVRASGGVFTGITGGTVGGGVALYFEDGSVWDTVLMAADDAWITGDALVTIASGSIGTLTIANVIESGTDPESGSDAESDTDTDADTGDGDEIRTARVAAAAVELAGGHVSTLNGAGTDAGTTLVFSASYDAFSTAVSNLKQVKLAGNALTISGGSWENVGGFDFGNGGEIIFAAGMEFAAGVVSGRGSVSVQSGDVIMIGDTTRFRGDLAIAEGASFALSWDALTEFGGAISGSGDFIALGSGTIALTGDLDQYTGNGFRLGDDTTLMIVSELTGDVRISGGTASVVGLADHVGDGSLTVDGEGTRVMLFGSAIDVAANNGTLIYGGCTIDGKNWNRATGIELTLDDSIFGEAGYWGSFFAGCGAGGTMGEALEEKDANKAIRLTLVDGYAFDTVALGSVDGGEIMGDMQVTVEGGTINQLVGGGDGGSTSQNVHMLIKGGTIGTIYGGDLGEKATFGGKVNIELITEKPDTDKDAESDGDTEPEEKPAAGISIGTIYAGGKNVWVDNDVSLTIKDNAGTLDIAGDIWFSNIQFNVECNLTASVEDSGFALFGGTIHGWAEQRAEDPIGTRKLKFVRYTTDFAGSFTGFSSVSVDSGSDVFFTGENAVFRTDEWDIAGDVFFAGAGAKILGVDSESTPVLKGKGKITFSASMTFGCTMTDYTGSITLETAEDAALTEVVISKGALPAEMKVGGMGSLVFTGNPAKAIKIKGSFKAGSELHLGNNSADLSGKFGAIAMGAADGSATDESVVVTFDCSGGITVENGITGANTEGDSMLHFNGVGTVTLKGAIDGGTAANRTLAFTKYAGTISLDTTPITNFDTLALANDAALVFSGGTVSSGVTEYLLDLTARSAGFASTAMLTCKDTQAFDPTAEDVNITLKLDAAQLTADTAYILIKCDDISALSGRSVSVTLADGTTGAIEVDGDLWHDAVSGCYWELSTGEDALSLFKRLEAVDNAARLMSESSFGGDAEDDKSALTGMLA